MRYETFATLEAAEHAAAQYRAAGRNCYVVTYAAGCHQVRSWA